MAVIEDHGENGEAAQALEFGDVGGQPGWALDGQRSWTRVSGVQSFRTHVDAPGLRF